MSKKRTPIIGIDLADLGSNILSAAHLAGKAVLSAFGAGAIAAPVEQLESPYLKDWARSTTSPTPQTQGQPTQASDASQSIATMQQIITNAMQPTVTVYNPDFVIIIHSDPKKQPDFMTAVSSVVITGGRRIPGNGYSGPVDLGKKFSFGYDHPHSVVVTSAGKQSTLTDCKQILFAGGIEDNKTSVAGLDPVAILEGSPTMAENNNLNLNERERMDLERANGGEEFSGETSGETWGDGEWHEIVGSRVTHPVSQITKWNPERVDRVDPYTRVGDDVPCYGVETPDFGTGEDLLGVHKDKPAGGVHNPHGYKHGEFVFGDILGVMKGPGKNPINSMNSYVRGTLALAGKKVSQTTPSHAGFQIKTTPKGRKFTSLVVNRNAKHDPKKTVATAKQVAARAQQVGNTALKAIAAKTKAVTKVHGIIGAAKVAASPGIAALKAQAQKVVDAGKKLAGVADKYDKVVKAIPAKEAKSAAAAKKITKIQGDGSEIVGDDCWYEIIGGIERDTDALDLDFTDELVGVLAECLGVDANGLYPGMPGYDPSTDPDSGGAAGTPSNGAVIPGAGITSPSGTPSSAADTSSVPGPPDYGAGAVPTLESVAPVAGEDFMPDPNPAGDDQVFYDCPTDADLPLGAIVFDGSRVPPFQGLGNYTVFFGQMPGSGPPKGGPNSGYSFHKPGDGSDSGWWLELMGTQPSFDYNGAHNFDHIDQFGTWIVGESEKNNWGPLIGNPQGGWTKGLRFSPSGPNGPRWFWFYDTAAAVAPWAVQPVLQQRLNDAIVAYKAAVVAGQTDYVNQQLQDKLNAQQAAQQAQVQAQSDAQIAMQQQQADAQNAIAQQQQGQQASQLMIQEQQQADAQAAAQAQLQQQAQQTQLQYFQQHPEQMFTTSEDTTSEDTTSNEEGGIDWGTSDNGSAEEAALNAADQGSDVSADDLMSEG